MSPTCPPLFVLERLAGGERWAGAGEHAAHVEGCSACRARLQDLQLREGAWRASAPANALRSRLEAQAREPSPGRWRWLWAAGLVAALTTLVVVVVEPPPAVTPKGSPLSFVVQRGSERLAWAEGAPLVVGDVLQPIWTGNEASWVLLVARDREGAVERIFPSRDEAALLVAGPALALGGSIQVDSDTDGVELWVFSAPRVFSLGSLEPTVSRGELPDFDGRLERVRLKVP